MSALDWILVGLTFGGMITATVGVSLLSRRKPEIVNPEDGRPATPIGRLKEVIGAGDWNRALPPVLVMGGLVTFMVSGALYLMVSLGQVYGGGTMLLVAIGAIVKLVLDWRRGA